MYNNNNNYYYYYYYYYYCGPGELSRYSDLLRAERSGDRIPVRTRYFALVQTGLGAQPASFTMDTGSSPGVRRLKIRYMLNLPDTAYKF